MEKRKAAGVLIVARNTGRYFLMKRGTMGKHPLTWAMPSGELEIGERPLDGLKREMSEETQINPEIVSYHYVHTEKDGEKDFYYYAGFTDTEFEPTLNEENLDWGWFEKDDLPRPLYPRMDLKVFNMM